jgi:hypothetical protein
MAVPTPASRASTGRKMLLTVVAILLGILAFATWYAQHFSMGRVQAYEVAGAAAAPRIVLATQGSAFKDAVVAGVVAHLKSKSAQVKVVDVAALGGVRETDCDAVVILHTWEMRKPPADVAAFVARWKGPRKLVVLTTSGAGDFSLQGVDAISAASSMPDVPRRVAQINARLDAVLEHASPAQVSP